MKHADFSYTKVKRSEIDILMEVLCKAHLIEKDEYPHVKKFLKLIGLENLRAVRIGGEIIGGVQLNYWGHFFGGKSVKANGIAFVGIKAEYRRMGAATFMMNEVIKETCSDGIPISTLFPANLPLYRKSGYEVAIERKKLKVKLSEIHVRNMECDMVEVEGKSAKPFRSMLREYYSQTNGNIDRNDARWMCYVDPPGEGRTIKYLIKKDGHAEGYAILLNDSKKKEIALVDYALFTRRAGERLLTFLADHSSSVKTFRSYGSFADAVLQLLPDLNYELVGLDNGMLRIVSVKNALEARGYPVGLTGELHFDVADDLIENNNGKFILIVKDGKGRVVKGGKGRLKIDIRTLAPLYTGYLSPWELRLCGKFECPDEDLGIATSVFSGPRPWMREEF